MRIIKVKKSAFALAFLAMGLSAAPVVADEVTQTRDVGTFTGILIEGAMSIEVKVGEKQTVTVTVDGDLIDRVETTVKGNILTIDQNGRNWRNKNLEVSITVAELNSLTVEGAADATIEGISSDNFIVDIGGAVDLTLEGECVKSSYKINGAGDINAKDFICEEVFIEINGAGDADVYASEKITATLNGVGNVTVYGDPSSIRPRINGLGSFDMK
jgi:hypothetical protein